MGHTAHTYTCMNAKLQALLYGDLVWGQFVTRCPQPCSDFRAARGRLAWGYVSLLSLISRSWFGGVEWWPCNAIVWRQEVAGRTTDGQLCWLALFLTSDPSVYIRLVFIRNRRRLFWFPFSFVHESMDYYIFLPPYNGAIVLLASFLSFSLWMDIRVITF